MIQIFLVSNFIISIIVIGESFKIVGVPIQLIIIILLNMLSIFILSNIYKREEKRKIKHTEATHLEQFGSLVASVRSDRHDLNNHLTVISGLLKIKSYDAASSYIEQMIGDIRINNQVLTIKSPILASILFAKMNVYQSEEILFELNVKNEEIVKQISSTDLIRLISNLLDNAYDATLELPFNERKISLDIYELDGQSIINVKNTCILKIIDNTFFESGFSTKGENRGFGLTIIKEITNKYNGILVTNNNDNLVSFEIRFPNNGKNVA
ncbi:sensor histidine kinase [Anaerobacillus alkalidiazotrophicus]|uniref:sensor histidine kinase n=1 Tax=Anaerobacillus alkalidiazotrophicus TaxID=472963 RepID=UPI0008F90978|nr:GHKL domain-containing protein [Anaerobacillus alkalidiazotrophicus]